MDTDLGQLGTTFLAAVLANDGARAEETLSRIEERVLELKRQSKVRAPRTRKVSPETSSLRSDVARSPAPVPIEREPRYHVKKIEAEERRA